MARWSVVGLGMRFAWAWHWVGSGTGEILLGTGGEQRSVSRHCPFHKGSEIRSRANRITKARRPGSWWGWRGPGTVWCGPWTKKGSTGNNTTETKHWGNRGNKTIFGENTEVTVSVGSSVTNYAGRKEGDEENTKQSRYREHPHLEPGETHEHGVRDPTNTNWTN